MQAMLARILFSVSMIFPAMPACAAVAVPSLPCVRFQLPNGLTVVVHEDHKAPVVAIAVWFHVGSADEPEGKTGFAHLFEHLMFSGSENRKGSYFQPFEQVGATDMNGTTWLDRTNYYETVPSSALDMALWMESDRMGHLLGAIDQSALDAQRGVVQNEKREGENQPYGRSAENISRNVFPANHPYHHDTIGSMADLNAASLADVKQWFHDYYGAANTTLVLAGDVTPAEARAKAERYFGDIPGGPAVSRQQVWVTPLTHSTRGVQHDQVAQSTLMRTWVVAQQGADDCLALGLAARVLGGGRTSRLYQRLVFRDRLATDVTLQIEPFALASLFKLTVDVAPGVNSGRVEAALADEWRRFLARGPTPDELARAKMDNYSAFVRSLEQVYAKASILAEGQVYYNDPQAYLKQLARSQAETAAGVRDAARKWLRRGDYTLVVLPAKAGFDPAAEDRQASARRAEPGRPQPRATRASAWRTVPGQVDRSQGVPRVERFPELVFPALQRGRLNNGIEVILAERHATPVTQVQLMFDSGFAADLGRKPGTASFTTALLGESTRSLDAVEVGKLQERQGSILYSACSLDVCGVGLSALNQQLTPALSLLAEMVRFPAFKAEDIARLRSQTIMDIAQEKTVPVSLALRLLPPLLYGRNHAYGIAFTGSGTQAGIASLSRQDLLRFQRDYLRPDNLRILVVGDTTLDKMIPALNAVLGDWRAGATPVPGRPVAPVAAQPASRVFLLGRADAPQSLILVGLLAPPPSAPDSLDLGLANSVFGGAFSSRLNMNLREDKHWAYGASSLLLDGKAQRPMLFGASVQTDKTVESVGEIIKEARAIVGDRPLTAEEIATVKSMRVRALPGYFETGSAVLGAIRDIVVYQRPDNDVLTLKPRLEAIDQTSAEAALRRVLNPDQLTWVIVGDLNKIEAPLRAMNLGPVTVIDSDGRPVPE